MSTQLEDGIPLSIVATPDQRHFRLLELPPEILSLLTSDNPQILELKSSGRHGDDDAGSAVLCTHDKTYNLRQKNSSNTVYLLEPLQQSDAILGPTLQAVAQCHSTLELTAFEPSHGTALDHMRSMLPVYSSTGLAAASTLDQRALFDLIPYSEHECTLAFKELAAFALPPATQVYRPSASLAVHAWQSILTAATAQGIDLDHTMTQSGMASLIDVDSEVDASCAVAVLDLFTSPSAYCIAANGPDQAVLWIGRQLLEAEAAQSEVATKLFLGKWKDLLPEKWRVHADISKLEALSQTSDGGKSIMLKRTMADSSAPVQSTSAASAAGNKRKWHDKFRSTKR